MEYIINDSVIFKETEGLRYKDQAHSAIQLSVLQSGVLAEIIKAQGESIHRDVLLSIVWEKNRFPPSNHSLNHNVAFLRNSLKELGVNDAIVTVYRLGFKLGEMIHVNHQDVILPPDDSIGENEEHSSDDGIIDSSRRELPLNKRWQYLRQAALENKRFIFIYALLALILLLAISVYYWQKSAAETQHYVAMVTGCRTYSVYTLDNEQKDKYRHYAEYFLQSQKKHCAADDILLMYVQDEHGLRETLEGNNRAFFAICNFDKKRADFCYNSYFYTMVPK